jgi:hypothetical protein
VGVCAHAIAASRDNYGSGNLTAAVYALRLSIIRKLDGKTTQHPKAQFNHRTNGRGCIENAPVN